MEQRELGRTGAAVSAIGMGCAGMSEGYGTPDEGQSLRALRAALESGLTLFDSSDAYGNGHNEQLLGEALRGRRDQVTIATKVGLVREPGVPPRIDNSQRHIREACEASLRRLGVEKLDLYYLQRRDAAVPIEEVIGVMAELVKQGKVRYLGLSEVSADTLRRADRVHPIAAVQSEYSLWSREPEADLLSACRALGVTFVAYCPLGRAFLTGEVTHLGRLEANDFRQRMPRFQPGALEHNTQLLAPLGDLAAKQGCSRAQLALAWLLNKHPHVVPIPGSKQPEHVKANAAAAKIRLSPQEMSEMDALFSHSAVAGARLPAAAMAGIE